MEIVFPVSERNNKNKTDKPQRINDKIAFEDVL